MIVYLYNSAGAWIAFRTEYYGRYLFNQHGDWIGWFPWDDDDAVSREGVYLGTVIDNRLLAREDPPYRVDPGYPGAPAFPGSPGAPGDAGYFGDTPGFTDVAPTLLLADVWPGEPIAS